jgi:hypothetical protein
MIKILDNRKSCDIHKILVLGTIWVLKYLHKIERILVRRGR